MPPENQREDPLSTGVEPAALTGERPSSLITYLKAVGPGMMAGLADNDPAGVATYALAGAIAGYRQLWLVVVATFMVQAIQVTSARVGDVTQRGVLRLTRERYGWRIAALVAIVGALANQATLIADVAALGASLQILTGLPWQWFVLPGVLVLLATTIFSSFRLLKLLFFLIGTLLVSYVVTAFLVRPDWGQVLANTVLPTLPTSLPELEAAVALLGTTVSPYLLLWEAEGEREEHRTIRQFGLAEIDVTVGYIASDVVSYFIVLTTAATLHAHHQSIQTAADAASALRPLAGDLAGTIFALGLLGTALLAVPMFAISTGYIATETFGWQAGLSKTPAEAPGFYATLSLALLSGGLAALIGVDPIVALFDSQILDGFLMPVLIVVLGLLANDRHLMGTNRNTAYYNVWLVITFLVMAAGALWLLVSLA